jgi:hypothetical protein
MNQFIDHPLATSNKLLDNNMKIYLSTILAEFIISYIMDKTIEIYIIAKAMMINEINRRDKSKS